jgi:hypothetical protein
MPWIYQGLFHEEDAPVDTHSVSPSTTSKEIRWLACGSQVASRDGPTPLHHSLVSSPADVHDDESLMRVPEAWLLPFHTRSFWRCLCDPLREAGVSPELEDENLPSE